MITVKKEGILLSKTERAFENEGVLNPAVIRVGNRILVFYRAVEQGNFSTIGLCTLRKPLKVAHRDKQPLLSPEAAYEKHGIEDPRIVYIEGTYYLSYTAYDGINALGALATSNDLKTWKRHGIIVPMINFEEFLELKDPKFEMNEKYVRYNNYQKTHLPKDNKVFLWDKNLVIFPRKINGKFCFLHRIKPDIQIVVSVNSFEELTPEFWHAYFSDFNNYIVLEPKYEHEASYIGSGCPPIETKDGWLIIYHGVQDKIDGYVYSACAALLDLKNPQIELARLPYPLFFPEKSWELKGEVNNVCFPTGAIVEDETLYIYYGAADERIAVASLNINELLAELTATNINHSNNEHLTANLPTRNHPV
jgi:predicted GH43/DUF377 family glycosyl hydrolase